MASTVYYSSCDRKSNYGGAANRIHLEVANDSNKGKLQIEK